MSELFNFINLDRLQTFRQFAGMVLHHSGSIVVRIHARLTAGFIGMKGQRPINGSEQRAGATAQPKSGSVKVTKVVFPPGAGGPLFRAHHFKKIKKEKYEH